MNKIIGHAVTLNRRDSQTAEHAGNLVVDKTSIVLSHNSIAVHCFCAQSLIFTVLYKHFYIPCQRKNSLL